MRPYFVDVFVSYQYRYNSEQDTTPQSLAIMDAPGYSHFLNEVRRGYHVNHEGWTRTVVIYASGIGEARTQVKQALGRSFWQGYHTVRPTPTY